MDIIGRMARTVPIRCFYVKINPSHQWGKIPPSKQYSSLSVKSIQSCQRITASHQLAAPAANYTYLLSYGLKKGYTVISVVWYKTDITTSLQLQPFCTQSKLHSGYSSTGTTKTDERDGKDIGETERTNSPHDRIEELAIADSKSSNDILQKDGVLSLKSLEEMIGTLWKKACTKDVMIQSINFKKFQKEIKQLIDAGFPVSKLYLLHMFPSVFYNLQRFTELIQTLLSYGYNQEDIETLITNEPSIIEYESDDFVNSIKELNCLGIKTQTIIKLTVFNPAVVKMSTKKIKGRLVELREVFKTQDVFHLIKKSPHVLSDSMESIMEKYAYVFEEMGITQRQMMYSDLFNLPLEHLHTRHMFLVRSGYFKKVVNDKQISHNPTLDVIIDTSDEEFLDKFGGMSIEEYNVFKELLKKDMVISTADDEESAETGYN